MVVIQSMDPSVVFLESKGDCKDRETWKGSSAGFDPS